jgi:hypothetical protein
MDIYDFNPWWRSSQVPSELVGKTRDIRSEILSYLDYRQMILLYGMRRAGKSTLMYQIIDYLLNHRKKPPLNLFYYSFDLQKHGLDQVIDSYELDVLKKEIHRVKEVYLFLDEIQKLTDWSNKIKILYDRYPNLKIILSGSAALPLQKQTKESLAGRFFEFRVDPLPFGEFIRFKGADIDQSRESMFEQEIKLLLNEYLTHGGFIEAFSFSDVALRKYFTESLLERVVYKDIPESFPINIPGLLFRLLHIFAAHPGMYLDYKNLSNDLQVDHRTISSYTSYLAHSLLTNKLFNYSPSRLTSEKKLKRLYLSNTGFLRALNPAISDPSLLMETFYVAVFQTKFFYRSPQKEEVDMILDSEKKIIPVEIKMRTRVQPGDLKPLIKYMNRFHCKQAVVISKNDEWVDESADRNITTLPYWKYWSICNEIDRVLEDPGRCRQN